MIYLTWINGRLPRRPLAIQPFGAAHMSQPSKSSPWRIPLVRELVVILAIKLSVILGIKALWFTEPTVPANGTEKVSERLFGSVAAQDQSPTEESP
ncbi:cytochrome oxidase putative small subunit CydP [Azotobacter sp. CWF10]